MLLAVAVYNGDTTQAPTKYRGYITNNAVNVNRFSIDELIFIKDLF
jgi:hypothetical protein